MSINCGTLSAGLFVFVAVSSSGCSLIGYAVGGAIDGHDNNATDSVIVNDQFHNSDADISPADKEHYADLMRKAALKEGSIVTVVTSSGSFIGEGLKADTVLALRREPENSGREGLLPADPVSLTIRDSSLTRIDGRVMRLQEGYILLEVDGRARGFPFSALNAICLSDERVISAQDLASMQLSARLIRVPMLIMGQGLAVRYFPLHEVRLIRVSQHVNWGTGRIIGFSSGLALDILVVMATEEALSGLSSLGMRY